MSEENKAIVRKLMDAFFSYDEDTVKKTAKEVFGPSIKTNTGSSTPEKRGETMAKWISTFENREEFKRNFKEILIAEGEYVVGFQQWPLTYKDKVWDVNVTRLVVFRIQNGKIVEMRGTNNRSDLEKAADVGKFPPK